MNEVIPQRLALLRSEMKKRNISAYIIPGTDPHLSEYSAEHWKAREWVSGFDGSAGTVVVTTDQAGLWTDSRYFLQAGQQLEGTTIRLFKEGLSDTPSIEEWLADTLPSGSTVAIDGALFSTAKAIQLKDFFTRRDFSFITDFDPFGTIWENRPAIPQNKVFEQPENYCGRSTNDKITQVLKQAQQAGAQGLLLAALDEIAWLFNIRGTDVECNPVAICYAYVSPEERILFVDPKKTEPGIQHYLQDKNIRTLPYDRIYNHLNQMPEGSSLLLDLQKINYSLYNAIPSHCRIIRSASPVPLLKSIKNKTEIEGFRNAMVKDGVALVKFMIWLEKNVGKEKIKETTIAEKLIEYRSRQPLYIGESFATIAGYNAHGAIVHYHATEEGAFEIGREGFLLIDSGAQYRDGTTDITRTVAMGPLSDRQKRDYTLVLKGHIAIATCRFPKGTRGAQIDVLARKPLWDHGLNYLHGTGHGIGHFLNVHEGPQNIRLEENPTPLTPGMVTSNEPGVYLTDEYGIRLENLILTVEDKETDFGPFYKFETLTLFPFDRKAIDPNLLTPDEREWLNHYHRTVREKLSPELDAKEKDWLKQATEKI